MSQVVVQVELVVVHPDRVLLEGDPAQLAAVARQPVQARGDG